jgi:hypothetical protein
MNRYRSLRFEEEFVPEPPEGFYQVAIATIHARCTQQ